MFFENLSHIIGEKYFQKIPMNSTLADSTERWFRHLAKLKFETCTDNEFWLSYWIDNPCMTKPTPEDRERLKKTLESVLVDYELVLCTSLKMLIANDMENLTSTENLHQYHLMIKEELKRRDIPVQPEDSFIIDIKAKKEGKLITEQKKEQLRQSGEKCIHCGSDNIISNGNMWTCSNCKKSFRKH